LVYFQQIHSKVKNPKNNPRWSKILKFHNKHYGIFEEKKKVNKIFCSTAKKLEENMKKKQKKKKKKKNKKQGFFDFERNIFSIKDIWTIEFKNAKKLGKD